MRSGWVAQLQAAYPKARIQATVYVRGGGGCQHYRERDRIAKNIVPRKPGLVFIGGISQRDTEFIRECIQMLRAGLPEVEILLASGAFGSNADPRDAAELAKTLSAVSPDESWATYQWLDDQRMVRTIEKTLGVALERRTVAGFDYTVQAPKKDAEFARPPREPRQPRKQTGGTKSAGGEKSAAKFDPTAQPKSGGSALKTGFRTPQQNKTHPSRRHS